VAKGKSALIFNGDSISNAQGTLDRSKAKSIAFRFKLTARHLIIGSRKNRFNEAENDRRSKSNSCKVQLHLSPARDRVKFL
jgi:hypothetical protein